MGHAERSWRRALAAAAVLVASAAGAQASADPSEPGRTDLPRLAFRLQSPLSDVTALGVWENLAFGYGELRRVYSSTDVIWSAPLSFADRWKLVVRGDLPILYFGDPVNASATHYGLGDTDLSALIAPAGSRTLSVGVGPSLVIPTATSVRLGTGKWSAGPAVALFAQWRPWTAGVLAEQVWSFAGPSDRLPVRRLRLFPVLSLELDDAWYLTSAPELTADWNAAPGQTWLVPVGAGVGKVYALGPIPFDVELDGFYNVVRPQIGPEWSVRAQIGLVEFR